MGGIPRQGRLVGFLLLLLSPVGWGLGAEIGRVDDEEAILDGEAQRKGAGDRLVGDIIEKVSFTLEDCAKELEGLANRIDVDDGLLREFKRALIHGGPEAPEYDDDHGRWAPKDQSQHRKEPVLEFESEGKVLLFILEDLLGVLNEGCVSLGTSVRFVGASDEDGPPSSSASKDVASQILWAHVWSRKLNAKLNDFLDACFTSEACREDFDVPMAALSKVMEQNEHLKDFLDLGGPPSDAKDTAAHPWLSNMHRRVTDVIESGSNYFQAVVDPNSKDKYPTLLRAGLNLLRFPWNTKQLEGDLVVDLNTSVAEVPDAFLSVALQANVIAKHWKNFDTKSKSLRTLAGALSPAVLRFGGSYANFLYYDPASKTPIHKHHPKFGTSHHHHQNNYVEEPESLIRVARHPKQIDYKAANSKKMSPEKKWKVFKQKKSSKMQVEPSYDKISKDFTNFTMSASDWYRLVNFTDDLSWPLLFDLNQFNRDVEDLWLPDNVVPIMEDAAQNDKAVLWQLGNEPNAYQHKFSRSISPEQTAADFQELRGKLEEIYDKRGRAPFIVGPEVTRPKRKDLEGISSELPPDEYLRKFLESDPRVDAVSWHHYYVDGRTATVSDFVSPDTMDSFPAALRVISDIRNQFCPQTQIWLTETSSAFGGGAKGLSDAYVDGFLWMDKLGQAALGDVSLVARQSLVGGFYALVDDQGAPLPDYWLSLLYKRLVGNKVLQVDWSGLHASGIRLYAHCTNQRSKYARPGSVTVFGVNVEDQPAKVNHHMRSPAFLEFLLEPGAGLITSRDVLLNGKRLVYSPKTAVLPPLVGAKKDGNFIHIPAKTMGFWVFPEAGSALCY